MAETIAQIQTKKMYDIWNKCWKFYNKYSKLNMMSDDVLTEFEKEYNQICDSVKDDATNGEILHDNEMVREIMKLIQIRLSIVGRMERYGKNI